MLCRDNVWVLWAAASLLALTWFVLLGRSEPFVVFAVILGSVYSLLGTALYVRQHYAAFSLVVGWHIVFTLCAIVSTGMPLLPSSFSSPPCLQLSYRKMILHHRLNNSAGMVHK
jgi:hypothetical protein